MSSIVISSSVLAFQSGNYSDESNEFGCQVMSALPLRLPIFAPSGTVAEFCKIWTDTFQKNNRNSFIKYSRKFFTKQTVDAKKNYRQIWLPDWLIDYQNYLLRIGITAVRILMIWNRHYSAIIALRVNYTDKLLFTSFANHEEWNRDDSTSNWSAMYRVPTKYLFVRYLVEQAIYGVR